MNVFVLDIDTTKCAEYHNDKHCVKMILETAQLLCGVHWLCGVQAPYKLTHKNHPCSIWARQSMANYNWLLNLGLALCKEYSYRYGKTHKCEAVISWCRSNTPNIPQNTLTEFPQAMPEQYKSESAVTAYRNYYLGEKVSFCRWTKRDIPEWFKSAKNG